MTHDQVVYTKPDMKALSLVSWRIRKIRSEMHRRDVHRQLLEQLHTDKAH